MASPLHPPALLQCLGKYQAPGLKTSRALGPQERRSLKPKTNLTSSSTNSPSDLSRESNVTSFHHLSANIHPHSSSGTSTQAARAQPTSSVGGVGLPHSKPRPALPDSLTSCREPSKCCSALLDTLGVGVTRGSCPVCPTVCRGPFLAGALK